MIYLFQIALVEPEIPPNTGNVARLCAATGSVLHLIEPLGFSIADRDLKRAGLDYWHLLELHVHSDWHAFRAATPNRCFYLSTKAAKCYTAVNYEAGDILVFGAETRGLSEEILAIEPDNVLRIPILQDARSLNLGNSVAVVLYEALRQKGFEGLKRSCPL